MHDLMRVVFRYIRWGIILGSELCIWASEALGVLPWINTATSGSTRKARQRRQPHTRIPALAALNGARTGTATQVQSDHVQAAGVPLKIVGDRSGNEGITDTVEPVLAQAVALCDFEIDGICVNMRR